MNTSCFPFNPSSYKEQNVKTIAIFTAAGSLIFSGAVLAQTRATNDTQRDVNQQERIEQGLKSGELTTHEAGKLERQEAHVDRMESRAMSDGKISNGEQARITAAQNRVSGDIYKQKHDAQVGNPNSRSSQRMQTDVQRNVNQEQRINNGLQSGALTNREAAGLEHGQAKVDRKEANAAADGHVGPVEQSRIQNAENHQSRRIARLKHN
jgi:hypothetical protein